MRKRTNVTIEFPECFEELTTEEWRYFLNAYDLMTKDDNIDIEDVRNFFAMECLVNRGKLKNFDEEEYLLIRRLADTLHWLIYLDKATGMAIVPIDTTRQLLPSWDKYVGPKSHAADLTFGEFRYAVAAMNAYITTYSEEHLFALTAILYRKGTARTGKMPFIPEWIGKHVEEQRLRIPFGVKYGIYLWFAHLCEYIRTGTFLIGGHEVCFAPLFVRGSEEGDGAIDLGLEGIRLSVAESGIFGTAEQVDKTLLLDVLLKLLQDKQTIDKLNKRYSHADTIR